MHLRPDNLRGLAPFGRMAVHAAAGRAEDAIAQFAPLLELLQQALPVVTALSVYAVGAYLVWRAAELARAGPGRRGQPFAKAISPPVAATFTVSPGP
jgi:hypothetical protein